MRLILIRHGDPDYLHDSLTEKGQREAALLAKRAKKWKVDDVYTSPLGRARATAAPCLTVWDKEATVLDWAQEFFYLIDDGQGGKRIPWDFHPGEWTGDARNFSEQQWLDVAKMQPLREKYDWVSNSLDRLLKEYGYERDGRAYRAVRPCDKTAVIFCHFGIAMVLLSHLINLPTEALWHGLFLPPTSVTVLNTQEHAGEAYFRVERLGDCAHLITGGEPVSESGYFARILQEL